MKKNNNKTSRSKIKRSQKNKKRLSNKKQFSKFERKQIRILDSLRMQIPLTLGKIANNREDDERSNS